MKTRRYSCVSPDGHFIYGIHKPHYEVTNLRLQKNIDSLGSYAKNDPHLNTANFPDGDIKVKEASWVYEIPNALPFRGVTYIDKNWADSTSLDYSRIQLPPRGTVSFQNLLQEEGLDAGLLQRLPRPLLITLATCSTDPADLVMIAELCCSIQKNKEGEAAGLSYKKDEQGYISASITDHDLFEAVANNPHLPDDYKRAMVLRPGAQGRSEIVGEWLTNDSHIYEYLRKNSYISGGHYAANMADDAVRYSISSLNDQDFRGLRHLYYQRMYVTLYQKLYGEFNGTTQLNSDELEKIRHQLLQKVDKEGVENIATLWGWNFGFDYSATDYRLHASHQQIHQQYAQVSENISLSHEISTFPEENIRTFSSGDMIAEVIAEYGRLYSSDFFTDYLEAISNNTRIDGDIHKPSSLIVWEDQNCLLFVPKAQTSQWELQIMTKPDNDGLFAGNIFETDMPCRESLDKALLTAQQILEKLGARLVTSIEFSKRIGERDRYNQPLLYSLLPKLPYSMGAFSEAQLRFINGHYPEDFCAACRDQREKINNG